MLAKHLCIGGPLNNQLADFEQIKQTPGYIPYNCSTRFNRTKIAYRRAKASGLAVPPSHIYVYQSIFLESPLND